MRSEAHLYLVRVQLLRGNTSAALLAAAAMEGSSPAEEQAAWAAICLAALAAAQHSGVQACLTHLRGQTLLHGSAVLGGAHCGHASAPCWRPSRHRQEPRQRGTRNTSQEQRYPAQRAV